MNEKRTLTAKSIARDALAQLQGGQLQATSSYCRPPDAPGVPCGVCGLGALFVAVFTDNHPLCTLPGMRAMVNLQHGWPIIHALQPWFSNDTLRRIERCFEGLEPGVGVFLTRAEMRFFFRYSGRTARLTAILKNIIDHDGEFVLPEQEWDWRISKQPRLLLAAAPLGEKPAYFIRFDLPVRETVSVHRSTETVR